MSDKLKTYGLKIGDILKESVLNEWSMQGQNYFSDGTWRFTKSAFIGDRTIHGFKEMNGSIGFMVSGTLGIYLKAKGFKEFTDNFDKPKVWKPEVGEYAIMEEAGGWGYNPTNNGCLAIISEVREGTIGEEENLISYISGKVLNPKMKANESWSYVHFKEVPIFDRDGDVICRKALQHEIDEVVKTLVMDKLPEKWHFKLPDEWYVVVTQENREILTKWRFSHYDDRERYNNSLKPGSIVGVINSNGKPSKEWNPTLVSPFKNEITFHQFKKYVLKDFDKDSFVLPERWYIKVDEKNVVDLTLWSAHSYSKFRNDLVMLHCKTWSNVTHAVTYGYTEISYEQFKKHVHNKNESFNPLVPDKMYYDSDIKQCVTLNIPEVKKVVIDVDYSLSTKLVDLELPDFTVKPKIVERIKLEPFILSIN